MSYESKERDLVRVVARLADTLVDDFDVIDVLQTLADDCAALFHLDVAGVLLSDRNRQLELAASTTDENHVVEILQLAAHDGPSLDAFQRGQVVEVQDIASVSSQWTEFSQAAARQGYAAIFAIPMRLRSDSIGTLNLLRAAPGPLKDGDLEAAQALADITTLGILRDRALRERDTLVEQLQGALNSRIVIEQAKGVIAHTRSLSMDEAFQLLRQHARSNHLPVSAVASAIANRELVL